MARTKADEESRTEGKKTKLLHIRVTTELEGLINEAMAHAGTKNVSRFIRYGIVTAARQILSRPAGTVDSTTIDMHLSWAERMSRESGMGAQEPGVATLPQLEAVDAGEGAARTGGAEIGPAWPISALPQAVSIPQAMPILPPLPARTEPIEVSIDLEQLLGVADAAGQEVPKPLPLPNMTNWT